MTLSLRSDLASLPPFGAVPAGAHMRLMRGARLEACRKRSRSGKEQYVMIVSFEDPEEARGLHPALLVRLPSSSEFSRCSNRKHGPEISPLRLHSYRDCTASQLMGL